MSGVTSTAGPIVLRLVLRSSIVELTNHYAIKSASRRYLCSALLRQLYIVSRCSHHCAHNIDVNLMLAALWVRPTFLMSICSFRST